MPAINYFALFAAAVSSMIVGAVWYGPLFGKLWIIGMGWDPQDAAKMAAMKQSAGPKYAQQFVGSLLMAFVLAHVLWAFRVALPEMAGVAAALMGGFWMWLGFILPVKYGDMLWGGKQFKYLSIDLGNYLVTLLVMGLILTLWR